MVSHTSPQFPDLKDKTLVITGTTRGIGRALLPGLLDQGLKLILLNRRPEVMEPILDELDPQRQHVTSIRCDLADRESIATAGESIIASGVAVDAILHNAAIDTRSAFSETDMAFWDSMMQVNLLSAIDLTRRLLPLISESAQGRILFTGSVMDALGSSHLTSYVTTKAATTGLTRALAHELKGTGITVNCIIPGAIQVEKEQTGRQINQTIIDWQSIPRRLVPEDLLATTCLMLSGAGGAITGQCFTIDGGLLHPIADPAVQGRKRD